LANSLIFLLVGLTTAGFEGLSATEPILRAFNLVIAAILIARAVVVLA